MCGKSFLAVLTAIPRAYDRLRPIDYSGRRRRRRRRRRCIGSSGDSEARTMLFDDER